MILAHVPISVANGFTSMMRNMLLTSSIGFAVFTFSDTFKEYKKYVKILAYCIFIYSIIYGLIASNDFNKYLHIIEKNKDLTNEDRALLSYWHNYDILAYIYAGILILFIFVKLKRDFS